MVFRRIRMIKYLNMLFMVKTGLSYDFIAMIFLQRNNKPLTPLYWIDRGGLGACNDKPMLAFIKTGHFSVSRPDRAGGLGRSELSSGVRNGAPKANAPW